MFSGIVETTVQLLSFTPKNQNAIEIKFARPAEFNDLSIGDSIAVNGVCLTVEAFDAGSITATLGYETLRVTGWTEALLRARPLNLERSLRADARVHGHFVSGHVDSMGRIASAEDRGGSLIVRVSMPAQLCPFVWPKGSLAVNGVSLTVNRVDDGCVELCLIPETLRRTNLSLLKAGDEVTLEVDPMARGLVHLLRTKDLNEVRP